MDTIEEWRDVVGYEGFYMVSNLGNIKSKNRILYNRWGAYIKKTDELAFPKNIEGYRKGGLTKDKICKKFSLHRLVAIAFIPNPILKDEVNHINGIRDDNRTENLEWCTKRENQCHSARNKNCSSKFIGVYFDKDRQKWSSGIQINRKRLALGRFDTEEEAFKARVDYEKKLNIENKYTFIKKE
jgi:hypothetical protein